MNTSRVYRLEHHLDGQAILLETTTDPERARNVLDHYAERIAERSGAGRLVLFDEKSGQVLARKAIRAPRRKPSPAA